MLKGNFVDNLPKIYGIYTGGFIAFIILMAIGEQMGMTKDAIGICFVGFTIFIYAAIGWLSRTAQASNYYVAGRQVPTVFNGMATAADWMSGASFVAMAGGIYFKGYGYMALLVGWTGGYVLVATLLAPYLRKFGCYTVPDFVGTRYGGNGARLMAVIVLTVASFTYVTAQITATGRIASVALNLEFELAVYVGLASILLCSMLGGMRGVTWTQVAQYIVLIIAYLLPVFWISNNIGAGFFPHFMLADEVARIGELEQQFGFVKNSKESLSSLPAWKGLAGITKAHSEVNATPWQFISLALAMMMGTASLPHVMMRYFTTPSVKAARKSVGWSVFFIFLLYSSAPMLATLSKLALIDPELSTGIIGKSIAEVQALDWYQNWNQAKLMVAQDFNANGTLELNELFMNGDAVVLATPEIAGLPYVISGLVAAGGLAAAMSTADGLILAIANAISHDVYYKMIDPKAETAKRLVVARVLLVVIGIAGASMAALQWTGILGAVIWAFDFAMSGLFWPLVLGVWWKRANKEGAIAGMALGLISGTAYLIYMQSGGTPIFGIVANTFGILGSTVSLVAMVVVSLMTSAPNAATQKMVDDCRVPAGAAVIGGQK
jgi:cation/acetate symporter